MEFYQFCPHIFSKFVRFFASVKKIQVSKLFRKMSRMQNLSRDGHGKSSKSHGKTLDSFFWQSLWEPFFFFFFFFKPSNIHIAKTGSNVLVCAQNLNFPTHGTTVSHFYKEWYRDFS